MTAYCQTPATGANVKTQDRYVVTGPTMVDGLQGMEVEIQRGGKRWRREVYRMTGDTLELLAAQDENSDLMRYSPPLPLIKYPVHEGDSQLWHGEFRLNNMKLLSRAQCRVQCGRESQNTRRHFQDPSQRFNVGRQPKRKRYSLSFGALVRPRCWFLHDAAMPTRADRHSLK